MRGGRTRCDVASRSTRRFVVHHTDMIRTRRFYLRDSPACPHLKEVEWDAAFGYTYQYTNGDPMRCVDTKVTFDEALAFMRTIVPDSIVICEFISDNFISVDSAHSDHIYIVDIDTSEFEREMVAREAVGHGSMPRVLFDHFRIFVTPK